jgi:hypothetical protein
MFQQYLRFPLFALVVGALSGIGQSAQAESGQLQAQTVQACEFGGFPGYYVRVQTNSGDDLAIRSAPAGTVVGAVPNGWAVRVLEWSRNGYWVKITSQYAYAGPIAFGSAPNFREGWVSAGYVKDLGRFCDKPLEAAQLVQPEIFGDRPVQVQGDWLAMADQLAQSLH